VGAFTGWAAAFRHRPLSLFFLLVGAVFALLAVTSGFELPILKQVGVSPDSRIVALLLGLGFLGVGVVLYFFPYEPLPGERASVEVKRWHVGEGGLHGSYGRQGDGKEWELSGPSGNEYGIYGPYEALSRGEYRAVFSLKIDGQSKGDDVKTASLEVTARHAGKRLAVRDITIRDFERGDKYQDFSMPFTVWRVEDNVEFRVAQMDDGRRLTLEYIALFRIAAEPQGKQSDPGAGSTKI
jgi:hypothetical protein